MITSYNNNPFPFESIGNGRIITLFHLRVSEMVVDLSSKQL